MRPLRPPKLVSTIAKSCHEAGGRAFLVGGCVRDHLMGRKVKDWDIEVYGLPIDDLIRLLKRIGRVNAVGKSFGVLKLHRGDVELDVSIPRRDSNKGPGHKGIHVEGDPDMPLEEAARRRDLTINAIMFDIVANELIDPWGGQRDLADGVLRAVDRETFLEDPLRALRVVQFAARLAFDATPSLKELCREAALDELPAERVQGEWAKLLLKAKTPSRGLRLAAETAILERVFPELEPADPAILDRLVQARDALEPEGRRWAVMLVGWLHRSTPEPTLDRLWLHKWKGYALRTAVDRAVEHLEAPIDSDAALRNLSTKCELEVTLLARHGVLQADDALQALRRARELGIAHSGPSRLLEGRHLQDLGVQPGPDMGRIIKAVYQKQLDGVVSTHEEALAAARALID